MKEKERESNLDRRTFIGTAAVAGAVLAACGGGGGGGPVRIGDPIEPGPQSAPDGPLLKAGLIGCGGRGTGAAGNFLDAGPNLEVVALSDVFQDRVDLCRSRLKEQKGVEIADDRCFSGFDAYEKLLAIDEIEYVIIATPPHFRPAQFKAAVEARKNVFMEKPVAVDPVGARSIMETAERADAFGLRVATGTQRRHQRHYIDAYNEVMSGVIGPIVSARCYWNMGQLWFKERQEGWSDMEWMIRDWVNWCWLSGDHIVEQHVHNIDVVNWFTNDHPVKAVGMGGRARRVTGDQFDFFSIDYELENGVHVASMCRQVDGCANNVSEALVGTKGRALLDAKAGKIVDVDGQTIWEGAQIQTEGEAYDSGPNNPYVQEHVDLVTAIRTDGTLNEARNTAVSTLTAIMGRISAYTGMQTTWDEMMASDLRLGPSEYVLGDVEMEAVPPVPGAAPDA
jgi:predicted dehydrogenase